VDTPKKNLRWLIWAVAISAGVVIGFLVYVYVIAPYLAQLFDCHCGGV
jgi:hypothetical protein